MVSLVTLKSLAISSYRRLQAISYRPCMIKQQAACSQSVVCIQIGPWGLGEGSQGGSESMEESTPYWLKLSSF